MISAKKLLTICIPTYNRSQLLDKQLNWLAQEIVGIESNYEIIISDNCSTDRTQDIIPKWQDILIDLPQPLRFQPPTMAVSI